MSSTIEHLRIAHRLALRAQHSSTFDAAALVRTWPQVTASALAAHRTLTPTGASEDRIVERIALDARSLHEGFERQPWPSEGGRDLALLQVAAAFDRATADHGQPALSKPRSTDELGGVAARLTGNARLFGENWFYHRTIPPKRKASGRCNSRTFVKSCQPPSTIRISCRSPGWSR